MEKLSPSLRKEDNGSYTVYCREEQRECRPSVPGPDLEMPSWVPEMNGRPLRAGWSWREGWGLRERRACLLCAAVFLLPEPQIKAALPLPVSPGSSRQ